MTKLTGRDLDKAVSKAVKGMQSLNIDAKLTHTMGSRNWVGRVNFKGELLTYQQFAKRFPYAVCPST